MNKLDLSRIDSMINDSLIILFNSDYGERPDKLVDENGINLSRYNGDILAKEMQRRGLINYKDGICELTPHGAKIVEEGGYLKFRDVQKGSLKNETHYNTNIDMSNKSKNKLSIKGSKIKGGISQGSPESSYNNQSTTTAPKTIEKRQKAKTSFISKHLKSIVIGIIVSVLTGFILLAMEYNWFV